MTPRSRTARRPRSATCSGSTSSAGRPKCRSKRASSGPIDGTSIIRHRSDERDLSTPELDRHLRIDQLAGDLHRRSLRGGATAFGAQGLKFVIQFGAVVVLARLLPPEAFGLIAMVAALNTVLDLIKEFGLSAATIQKPDI